MMLFALLVGLYFAMASVTTPIEIIDEELSTSTTCIQLVFLVLLTHIPTWPLPKFLFVVCVLSHRSRRFLEDSHPCRYHDSAYSHILCRHIGTTGDGVMNAHGGLVFAFHCELGSPDRSTATA